MSVRLEWMHADDCAISTLIGGETAADNQELDLDGNPIAIQIISDEGFVIVGDKDNIINFANRIIEAAIRADDRYENQARKEDLDMSLKALARVFDGVAKDPQAQVLQNALDDALALLGMER